MKRAAVLPLLLFGVACAEMPTDVAPDRGTFLVAEAPGGAMPVTARATGNGHLFTGDALRTFAFTAKRFADGSAQGNMQIVNRNQGSVIHLKVACLEVHGNEAWIGGYVSRSDGYPYGTATAFRVLDNGEGAKATMPDQITLMAFWGTSGHSVEEVCADLAYFATTRPFRDIVRGNIQVR